MKRIISILLALCLVLSIAPVAFAADAATETGVKITYQIGKYVTADGAFSALTYESTGGYWAYDSNYNASETAFGTNIKGTYAGTGMQIVSNGAKRWFAMKIIIPASGTYVAEINRGKYTAAGAGSVYVIPVSTEITSGMVNSNSFGTFDCSGGTHSYFSVWEKAKLGNSRYLSAGEYYLVYKLDSGNNIAVGDITLSTVDAENAEYSEYSSAYMGIAAVSDTELEVGDTATASVVMTDSITHEAIADITYTSSNEAVATVAADGSITAKAPGTATISAKANGYAYGNVISKEITVTRPENAVVGTKVTYDIGSHMGVWNDASVLFSSMTYESTGGLWEYDSNSKNSTTIDSNFKYRGPLGIQILNGAWFAVKVNIPTSGTYKAEVNYGKISSGGGNFKVYILPMSSNIATAINSASAFGDGSCSGGSSTNYTFADANGVSFVKTLQNTRDLSAGEYYIVYQHTSAQHVALGNITLYTVDENGAAYDYYDSAYIGMTSAEDTELTVGDATEVSAIISDSMTHEAVSEFTYTSSNEAVATVNAANGVVTAVAPGTATISAVCPDYATGNVLGTEITVNAPTTDDNVSFCVTASETDATITVESDDFTYNGTVDSVARGSRVTLTAEPLEGYTFVGWMRGSSSDYASYISLDTTYETTLYSNAYITAVYVADADEQEAVVEYYNQNGDYIATLAPTEASPTPASITGFTFNGEWLIDEDTPLDLGNVTKRTRAVAKHTPKASAGIITVDGDVASETAFDSAVTSTASAGFTCWKRDGKIVSYNQNYTYYIWDTTTIAQSDEVLPAGAKLPIIVLDNDKVDGAYMIEYDAADFDIVEVGLLFNSLSNEAPTIASCTKKFTSQRNLSHGQMAAKDCDNVCGYLIYKDGENFRVIYDYID